MTRNADSMSILAKTQPWPKCLIRSIALSIVTYWRLKPSVEIDALILVDLEKKDEKLFEILPNSFWVLNRLVRLGN